MPFTLWSFPFRSLWGGGIDDTGYTLPEEPPGPSEQVIEGVFWLAQDQPGPSLPLGEIRGADSIGWAPGNLPEFAEAGDITLGSYARLDQGGQTDLWLVKSGLSSSIAVRSGWSESPGPIHAELFGHQNVTGVAGAPVPAFVMFNQSEVLQVSAHNIPLTDLSTVNSSVIWNNELGANVSTFRFVSLETSGTVIVVMAPSSQDPAKQSFYLKSTFGSGAATPATEILVDLDPGEGFEVVPGRFHVVETHNRALLFYYEVSDTQGNSHVAFMAYTPVHDTFAPDLPFNVDGVISIPTVVLNNHRPIDSVKGARRHQVSNSLVVGVEPQETTEQGLEIHWYATHGYGYTSFGPPAVWNEETHPHLFGGRLDAAAPDRKIRIISVGWADPRQGGIFPVVGSLELGEIPTAADFRNFYRTDQQSNQVLKRTCLGALYVPRIPFDSNPGGQHAVRYGRAAALGHEELQRAGYHMASDFLEAEAVLPMDTISAGVTPAKRGPGGVVSGGVVPTAGIVDAALYFFDAAASVVIPNDGSLTNDGISFSCWVFPEIGANPQDPDDLTILMQEGGDDIAARLWWNEDDKQFKWRVVVLPGGNATITSSSLGPLLENHWYHLTVTYDEESQKAQMFINGFLVSENQFFGDSVMAHSTSSHQPVTIGADPTIQAFRSFKGRVDDVVVGLGKGKGHHIALATYHYGLLSKDGTPMRGARTTDKDFQDQVMATVSAQGPGASGRLYTVSMRQVNMSSNPLLQHQYVFDVWKVERGEKPEFMGLAMVAPSAFDRRGGVLTETLGAPSVHSTIESFEMRLNFGLFDEEQGSFWTLTYSVRGDETGGISPALHTYWQAIDLDNPVSSSKSAFTTALVARLTGDQELTALDTVVRDASGGTEKIHVILAVSDGTANGAHIYLIQQNQFGVNALSTANKRAITDFMPDPSTSGSFFGRNYLTSFSGAEPPRLRGIISRKLTEGMGVPSVLNNGVHLIFGLEATSGGSAGKEDQIVSTLTVFVPPEAWDNLVVGNFPLPTNGQPRQLDEYGIGGIDPFIPLSWVQHPLGPTGDSLILGRRGARIYADNVRDGNGGLMLYSVPREGFWGVRVCAAVGPSWGNGLNRTVGASATMSLRPGEDEEEPINIYVSRPYPDRADKFSTVYASPEEASSGGWSPEDTSKSVIPVLRRNDHIATTMWTGHMIVTNNMTHESTGAPLKVGGRYRYGIVLRWSFPGSTFFTGIPE